MKHILTLLKPRIWAFKNPAAFKKEKGRLLKVLIFAFLGFFFWCGIFIMSHRVLRYFKSVDTLGDLLAAKLLSMVLITFFSLLVFSSILTFLSKLYLSKDLSLVHSLPVAGYKIFTARWIESTFDSSWMVMLYSLPVFISYGVIYTASLPFYLLTSLALLALSVTAAAISSLLVMLVVVAIPASRIRGLFVFLGISVFLILFIAFRLLRPERLVDPETFASVLFYLKALQTPSSPFLPSTWAFDTLRAALSGDFPTAVFQTALAFSGAVLLIGLNIIAADRVYFRGLSKAQTTPARLFRYQPARRRLLSWLPGPIRSLATKEIKTFFRDQTQWSQLFLIGALVVIYVYNFKVLPLEKSPIKTIYLQNLLAFLNMGLASFVLTAVTARFAYPAVSTEGEAFWLIMCAPLRTRTFLWVKFFIYFLPLLILTEIIVVATNWMLDVTPFMMALSTATIALMVPGVVAMGIGLGAAYADYKSENPAQTVTSFGGFLFMVLCAVYISAVIILEASPVYTLFMAGIRNRPLTLLEWVWTGVSLLLVLLLGILAIVLPMRYGEKKLQVYRQ